MLLWRAVCWVVGTEKDSLFLPEGRDPGRLAGWPPIGAIRGCWPRGKNLGRLPASPCPQFRAMGGAGWLGGGAMGGWPASPQIRADRKAVWGEGPWDSGSGNALTIRGSS